MFVFILVILQADLYTAAPRSAAKDPNMNALVCPCRSQPEERECTGWCSYRQRRGWRPVDGKGSVRRAACGTDDYVVSDRETAETGRVSVFSYTRRHCG